MIRPSITCRHCGYEFTPLKTQWVNAANKRAYCSTYCRSAAHHAKDPAKAIERSRRRRDENRAMWNAYQSDYRRRRMIGAGSNEEVDGALEAAGFACEICATSITKQSARFDHDHSCCPIGTTYACGKCFRGILCNRCNTSIGAFDDDPHILEQAAAYLRARSLRPSTSAS